MKTIWQGTLSFGLVNIPVGLYSAVESQSLGFTMLCGTCNNPITYKRWCNHCNKEIAWQTIVKGLKIKEDTYFVLTHENLHALKPTKTESIAIIEFVDPSLIDPIYLEKHYYVAPKKKAETAYFLFEEALKAAHKVAVGVFVFFSFGVCFIFVLVCKKKKIRVITRIKSKYFPVPLHYF